jgi:hypothetical protein
VAKKKLEKLAPEVKEQVLALAARGIKPKEVARQLGLENVQQVVGTIMTARNAVAAGSPPPVQTHHIPEEPMSDPAIPNSSAPASQLGAPPPPQLAADGHAWRSEAPGQGATFASPAQQVEYKLERVNPRHGILKIQYEDILDDEVCSYGEGAYRVWMRVGNKPPVYRDVYVSKAYGQPKFPSQDSDDASPARPVRPREQEADQERRPFRSLYRPMVRPGLYEPPHVQQDRGMSEFARHGAAVNESIAVTAISEMRKMHDSQLERTKEDRVRELEPSVSIQKFMEKQQEEDRNRRAEETRKADEARTKDQLDWRHREDEREAQHKRDMDRIKEESASRLLQEKEARQTALIQEREVRQTAIEQERENRKTMVELEQKKLDLIREEARSQQAALKGELDRIRAEAKEERQTLLAQMEKIQEKSDERIEAVEESVKTEIEKDRQGLAREHELRGKAMDNEHSLKQDMLKLREEIVKGQNGDETAKMIGKLVESLERTVKEVVELKKIEAVSAEGHIAKIGQTASVPAATSDVNVQTVPPGQNVIQEPHPAGQKRPGNGHTAPATQASEPAKEKDNMDQYIRQMSQDPFFQEVITEWGRHVEAQADATTFANMFMEWMRDDGTMESIRAKKACAAFVNHMQIRDWPKMYKLLEPAIPSEFKAAFTTDHATDFYEQFKLMVVESVKDYWKAYFNAKQAEQEAARQAAAQPETQPTPSEVTKVQAVPVA